MSTYRSSRRVLLTFSALPNAAAPVIPKLLSSSLCQRNSESLSFDSLPNLLQFRQCLVLLQHFAKFFCPFISDAVLSQAGCANNLRKV